MYDTICSATEARQSDAAALAADSDCMIVIGGRHSSNTVKLYDVSSCYCKTYHIEKADELNTLDLFNAEKIGITAGASTPAYIIKEVVTTMSELINKEMTEEDIDFAQAVEDTFKKLHTNARVKGIVTGINSTEVTVDLGTKQTGYVSVSELTNDPTKKPSDIVSIGDEIDLIVIKVNDQDGTAALSKKRVDQDIAWDKLAALKAEKAIVTGTVTDVVKGGVLVDVGLRGFVPASLLALGYVEDLNAYIGQELQMKIIECDKHSNKLILSAKAVLRSASKAQKEKTWAEVAEGQTRNGVVRRLTNFGAFVDIGGVDGLLHVSEMAWYRVNHPSDLLK